MFGFLAPKRLHRAAKEGNITAVRALLKKGVSVDGQDSNRSTALHLAAEEGHIEVVRVLLAARANVDAQDKYGSTPLLCAACEGNSEVVGLLLEAGANVNARNVNGASALIHVSIAGHADTAKLLVRYGADTNFQSKTVSGTPLILATKHKRTEVVRHLLLGGAHITAVDKEGMTAKSWAVRGGKPEIIELIRAKLPGDSAMTDRLTVKRVWGAWGIKMLTWLDGHSRGYWLVEDLIGQTRSTLAYIPAFYFYFSNRLDGDAFKKWCYETAREPE